MYCKEKNNVRNLIYCNFVSQDTPFYSFGIFLTGTKRE